MDVEFVMNLDADGIEYLRKLKQDEQTDQTRPSLPKRTHSIERRATPRYKCQGSAQVRKLDSDVRTWGSITDISLHGCYVEMATTFPVGTVVQLVLELNRYRVETKGEICAEYPFLGLGIKFTEMTAQDRRHLREMVGIAAREWRIVVPRAPSRASEWQMPSVANFERLVEALGDFFLHNIALSRDEFTRIATDLAKEA